MFILYQSTLLMYEIFVMRICMFVCPCVVYLFNLTLITLGEGGRGGEGGWGRGGRAGERIGVLV